MSTTAPASTPRTTVHPIVCGTDLSPASADALDVALALAKLRGDHELRLVHVAPDDAVEPELDKARADLAAMTAARRDPDLAIRIDVITGPPDEAVTRFAESVASDLVVVAARSKSTALLRLGGTSAGITANTHVPVIVVRDPGPWLAFARGERPLRVLVSIDDSAVCELGIQWTHALRRLGPVDVVLGAVYYPDEAAEHYSLDRKSMVDADPEIEQLLARDLRRRFGGAPERVTAHPRRGLGRIGDHVVELAREESVDAIVVGTTQKTGLGRLGSVSSVVVNDAPQSVVCIPPTARVPTIVVPELHSALVATDLSGFSNRAIPYAFAACARPDAEIHLVHVIAESSRADVAELARTLEGLAPVAASQRVTAHVVRGDDAAKAIATTAARLGVDLICMCSHGRSGITRALVGSVADRLLRATRLPVLVLRPA
jgi:nucleotide-binding universal stress UspA family protein